MTLSPVNPRVLVPLPARGQAAPSRPATPKAEARPFSLTPAAARREANQVGEFFKTHPSLGGRQIVLFHSYWVAHGTFQTHPLQAYLYHATRPVDDAGRPRTALWRAYAEATEAHAPTAEIERAFLLAHTADFKAIQADPTFKQLYGAADAGYRKVVDAYVEELGDYGKKLAGGADPVTLSRRLFIDTNVYLFRHRAPANGFMATWQGVKAMLDPRDPLSHQIWGSSIAIFKGWLGLAEQPLPPATRVRLSLSQAEAATLRRETGIPFKAGASSLTPEMLKGASVQEPTRGDNDQHGRPRYPLLFSDFSGPQKLREGQSHAGADAVMTGAEAIGALHDVQARVRSQQVANFFGKYPVPEAGILIYSANMLAMNGTYGQSEMFASLGNAVMPVDALGKPKNALWQAYADAYDQHKATGGPSMETLEHLWFRAHMNDFGIVDTPAFKAQLETFWAAAAKDKAMAPMAVYTQAMVGGRKQFEEAERQHLSEDSAFMRGFTHFAKTVAGSGSFPFWEQDLKEAFHFVTKPNAPAFDERGLPTDRTLLARSVEGIRMMSGLTRIIKAGTVEKVRGRAEHRPVSTMIDMTRVLTPAQLAQVDPRVIDFYRDPRPYDITTGITLAPGVSALVLGELGPAMSGLGGIPDRVDGFEGFPLETELYQDHEGGTHWDRYVVVDGKRTPLFEARFEVVGRQVRETFNVKGKDIALYFDVTPYQGGLRLTLDNKKSALVSYTSRITFTTLPTETGLATTGTYDCATKLVKGELSLHMAPKAKTT